MHLSRRLVTPSLTSCWRAPLHLTNCCRPAACPAPVQIVCEGVEYRSATFDPFLDLSLEITKANTLTRALQHFTAEEVLDGDNRYRCPKNNKLVSEHTSRGGGLRHSTMGMAYTAWKLLAVWLSKSRLNLAGAQAVVGQHVMILWGGGGTAAWQLF